jgi:hypothetical protein
MDNMVERRLVDDLHYFAFLCEHQKALRYDTNADAHRTDRSDGQQWEREDETDLMIA